MYHRDYSGDIAQPKDGHVSRTPPSPQLPSTLLTTSRTVAVVWSQAVAIQALRAQRLRTVASMRRLLKLSSVASPK